MKPVVKGSLGVRKSLRFPLIQLDGMIKGSSVFLFFSRRLFLSIQIPLH